MPYCMYLRKSRVDMDEEARGEGETLARHERTLIELANRQRLTITAIYKEVVSGETIAARPVMQRLLTEVEKGIWSGVLVMEVERLARGDTIDQGIMAQAFKYSHTKIITPIKTFDPNNEFDEEYFEFGLFMSRREFKTINRRLQRGRFASVREGKYVANIAPYGYVRKKLAHDKGFTLEAEQEESEIVTLIFDLYTRGEKQLDGTVKRLGIARIANRLNELQVPPKKADTWSPGSIRDILINPVYNGKIRWNWRPARKKIINGETHVERPRSSIQNCMIIDGLHKAIIEDDTWNLAQTLMKRNPPRPIASRNILQNPLAGIVYCGKCGRSLIRRPAAGNSPPTLMCPATVCDNVSSRLSIVEEHIIQAIGRWMRNYRIDWCIEKENGGLAIQAEMQDRALKKLDAECRNLEKQIVNIHDLLEQGVYTTQKFHERMETLNSRLTTVRQDQKALAASSYREENREVSGADRMPNVENALEVYARVDNPKLKNDILKELLEKVIYTKSVNARWHNSAHDFQIDIYPRLPREPLIHS